jgi:hypothetical protein
MTTTVESEYTRAGAQAKGCQVTMAQVELDASGGQCWWVAGARSDLCLGYRETHSGDYIHMIS